MKKVSLLLLSILCFFITSELSAQAAGELDNSFGVDGIVNTPVGPGNSEVWWDPLESTCRHASLSIL